VPAPDTPGRTTGRRIVVAGGSGFLGRSLVAELPGRGYDVVVLSRRGGAGPPGVRTVAWTPDGSTGPWAAEVDGARAVINLAGANIADKRWTADRKEELRSSRVLSTRSLVAAVRAAARKPATFLQGSAVGFYGLLDDRVVDESFPPGDDFFGRMAVAWEAEARPLEALDVRLAIIRSGVVLARDDGALKKMLPAFQWFVGGRIARGQQYFSWIHRDDWIAFLLWALEYTPVSGPMNATAPVPVTNAEFSRALGRVLRRPSWLPVPGPAVRLLVGELATYALLHGQRVVPKRALALGFQFKYPDIETALRAALGRR
jgi:hypothetical protein